jgi:hypothetical protein
MATVSPLAHYECVLGFMFCFLFDELFLQTTCINFLVAHNVAEEGDRESRPKRMSSNGRFMVKEALQARRRLSGMAAFDRSAAECRSNSSDNKLLYNPRVSWLVREMDLTANLGMAQECLGSGFDNLFYTFLMNNLVERLQNPSSPWFPWKFQVCTVLGSEYLARETPLSMMYVVVVHFSRRLTLLLCLATSRLWPLNESQSSIVYCTVMLSTVEVPFKKAGLSLLILIFVSANVFHFHACFTKVTPLMAVGTELKLQKNEAYPAIVPLLPWENKSASPSRICAPSLGIPKYCCLGSISSQRGELLYDPRECNHSASI